MTATDFMFFAAVPLRRRSDGWPVSMQQSFIRLLASGARPGEAARMLGKNRQNAYALRRRPGAEGFAAAWDAAAEMGRRTRAEERLRTATTATESRLKLPSHARANFLNFRGRTVAVRDRRLSLGR